MWIQTSVYAMMGILPLGYDGSYAAKNSVKYLNEYNMKIAFYHFKVSNSGFIDIQMFALDRWHFPDASWESVNMQITWWFAVVVHVTFTLFLCKLVHANCGSHQWSKCSQHKSCGISKFRIGAWAVAWASIQWLLTCTTTTNTNYMVTGSPHEMCECFKLWPSTTKLPSTTVRFWSEWS